MSKIHTTGMATHIAGAVTSLAHCWKIVRQDSKEFYFTDHDRDINFDGDIYQSESGYDRSAVANDASLSVNNVDVSGILDSSQISKTDIKAGLFNHATVYIFAVNWQDLTDRDIKYQKGFLGEVRLSPNGLFIAELRSLAQMLQQQIVESFTPTCLADLGDLRCGVPIWPAELTRETAVTEGSYYRVPTNPTAGRIVPLPVINRDFETADLTGWDTVSGTPLVTNAAGISAFSGSYYLRGTAGTGDYEVSQTIDISSYATPIDAGNLKLFFSVYTAFLSNDADDTKQVVVEALDGSDIYISDIYDSTAETIDAVDKWYKRGGHYMAIPATTRKIKIRLIGGALPASPVETADACFDLVTASVLDITAAREVYDDIIYNSDFETGDNTSWTTVQGTFSLDDSDSGTTPQSGQWFFQSKNEATTEIESEFDLTTIEISTTDIDNGLYDAVLSYYVTLNVADEADELLVTLTALDGSADPVKVEGRNYIYQQKWVGTQLAEDVWTQRIKTVDIPANTRSLKVNALFTRQNGTNNNVCLDDINLKLVKDPATEGAEIYENTIYQVTTPGTTAFGLPTYDTTPGNTTTDGTAVLTAVEAWTRNGTVSGVTSNSVFTISVTESRAIDDWFTGGVLYWETGDNTGRAVEIKSHTDSPATITLADTMNFDIQSGDKFRIYPGCNKIITGTGNHCKDKFDNVKNARGFPHVPGTKASFKYPDY